MNEMILKKLHKQDKILNLYKDKVLYEQQKKQQSIEKMIENQHSREEEKFRRLEEESNKVKYEAKKLHYKILQLQMIDKHKRRLEEKFIK